MSRLIRPLACIAWLLALVTATSAHSQTPSEFAASINAQLAAGKLALLRDGDFARDREAIQQLYDRRRHQPVWFQNGELTGQGALLLRTLRRADDHGLRPDDYDGTPLLQRVIGLITDPSAPVEERAELDLGMTVAAARMLRHLHSGRVDPRAAGFDLNQPRAPLDVAAALERLATSDDFSRALASVEPSFLHYHLLKLALHRYRVLALERGLTDLPALKGRSVRPGEAYDGIPALRRLLIAVDDLPMGTITSDAVLDETLAAGLTRFQRRHGLAPDGILGRRSLAALRVPLSVRAQQLALTLERWRWFPEFSSPPIIVNIPQFRLFAFRSTQDRAADILQMDVIVGNTYPATQTPAFAAEMKYVVFRPYWEVPSSILEKEMLPELRANLGYLDENNLEIVSNSDADAAPTAPSLEAIDQLAAGTLRLRQRPGDDNSLGLVKLMLPNPYSVYLHSTPARRLFDVPRRAFSHGCIRVSDPVGLVEHVLRDVAGEAAEKWTRERIEAAMNDATPEGQNRHVYLSKPIPVLVVYGTALALESGEVLFFEDLYGHDRKLEELLR